MSCMDYIHDPDANPGRPPAGTQLCRIEDVPPGKIKRFLFKADDREFRGLLIQAGGAVKGYVDWCPHWGVALQDDRDDIFIQEGLIACAWHWARFSPVDGKSIDGPGFEGLHRWPVEVGSDGAIRTA